MQNPSSRLFHQTRFDQWSNGCQVSEHTAGFFRIGDASGSRHVLGKSNPSVHRVFFLIHLRFPGVAVFISDCIETKHCFFVVHQARCPILHLASSLSFSVCVQGRFINSASRSARFSRVRFAIIWLSLLAINTFKRNRVKTFSNGHPCFQACNAVEAIINFGPRMSGRRLA